MQFEQNRGVRIQIQAIGFHSQYTVHCTLLFFYCNILIVVDLFILNYSSISDLNTEQYCLLYFEYIAEFYVNTFILLCIHK